MIAALLLVQATTVAPTEDIVVIAKKVAERIRYIKVDIKAPKRDGRVVIERCRVTRSSGVAELDAVVCDTARECEAGVLTTRRDLETCTERRSQGKLDAIVARWHASGRGTP